MSAIDNLLQFNENTVFNSSSATSVTSAIIDLQGDQAGSLSYSGSTGYGANTPSGAYGYGAGYRGLFFIITAPVLFTTITSITAALQTSDSYTGTLATGTLTGLTGSAGPEIIWQGQTQTIANSAIGAQGAYGAGTTYVIGNVVTSSSIVYISLVGSNTGNTPASSPTKWSPLPAAAYSVGAQYPYQPYFLPYNRVKRYLQVVYTVVSPSPSEVGSLTARLTNTLEAINFAAYPVSQVL